MPLRGFGSVEFISMLLRVLVLERKDFSDVEARDIAVIFDLWVSARRGTLHLSQSL